MTPRPFLSYLEEVCDERHLRRGGVLPGGHRLHLLPLLVLDERDERVLVAGAAVHAELAVLDAGNKKRVGLDFT